MSKNDNIQIAPEISSTSFDEFHHQEKQSSAADQNKVPGYIIELGITWRSAPRLVSGTFPPYLRDAPKTPWEMWEIYGI